VPLADIHRSVRERGKRSIHHAYIRRLWSDREATRYGSVVEPMLQWAKLKSAEQERQFVPCRAGVLSAVVHANGDVALRAAPADRKPARKILHGDLAFARAGEIRRSIRQKECYCTNEIFMWSSIIFQPLSLARSMIGAKLWERAEPLRPGEKVSYTEADLSMMRKSVE
jgi:hypothetical protein